MVLSVLIVDNPDCRADWKLWLATLPSSMRGLHCVSPARERSQFIIQSMVSTECSPLLYHHEVKKNLKSNHPKLNHHKLGDHLYTQVWSQKDHQGTENLKQN